MSVGLLIITHGKIGQELLNTATALLGDCPLLCKILSVAIDSDTDETTRRMRTMHNELDKGQGVLILTDMYGSTPSNLANLLRQDPAVRVIAGSNLPMLIRVLNYSHLNLDELADKAVSGGHDGVLLCASRQEE
ncbi:MAG: PTS fructose transporter subunit IIA [Gammaproteobacteria bacterium]